MKLSLIKYVFPIMLIGCASTVPQVEVVEPLPQAQTLTDLQYLHQKHFYTPQDHTREMYDVNMQAATLEETLDNLQWSYFPNMAGKLKNLVYLIVYKMNDAHNEEEFIFYHRLYDECVHLSKELINIHRNELFKIDNLNTKFHQAIPE